MQSERELYRAEQLPIFQNRMYDTVEEARECPRGDVRLVQNLQTGLIYNADFCPELMTYDARYQNEQAVSPVFKRHLDNVPGLKDIQLSKLTLQMVQGFLNEKLAAGNSPALVRYLRAVLRIALNQAVKGDLVSRNVAALVTPPLVEKKDIVPFTPEQANRFLNAALGHRLEAAPIDHPFSPARAVGPILRQPPSPHSA